MTRVLHVLHDPPLDGPANMGRDEHLLYSDEYRPAAIRIYSWDPPTLSLGYFQRFDVIATLAPEVRALDVVRRATGGGAILHDREVTYALALDDSVPAAIGPPVSLYRLAHECWRDALADYGVPIALAPDEFPLPTPRTGPFFCFEKPGRTDLVVGTQKLLGSAQRRVPGRVLQHGSLILGRRFADHPGTHLHDPPAEAVARWTQGFVARLCSALDLVPRFATWTHAALEDVAVRRARYADDEWTRRR